MEEPAELLLIKEQYELAHHALSRGLSAEQAGKRGEAMKCYNRGRQHLIQGLNVPTWGQKRAGAAWDMARHYQQRMRQTLGTVNTHLSDLQTSGATAGDQRRRLLMDLPPSQPPNGSVRRLYPSIPCTPQTTTQTWNTAPGRPAHRPTFPAAALMATPGDQPPAYTPQPTDGHRSLAHGPAGGGLGPAGRRDGDELLFIPSGVQMFFVAPGGEVSSLSYPGFLRIIRCTRQNKSFAGRRPSAYLNVCDRLYPLTADTPVLLANSGVFMFPDSSVETPGSFVGLVLSSELPATDRKMFQDLLSQLVDLRIQGTEGAEADVINLSAKVPLGAPNEQTEATLPPGATEKPPLPGWSQKMAKGILSGSTRLSQKLTKGAEVTGKAIHKGGGKLREHITPEEEPTVVSPHVTRGLETTQQVTGGAVRVSRFLVNGLSTVVGHVADKMAPHVKKHGAKLVPESMKKNEDGRPSKLQGAKFVAVSSVQGLSAIWSSLETGAKLVGKSVATETVTTVKHKYGDEAAQATDTGLQSVVNVGVAAYNIDHLATLAILDAAEKKTSKTSSNSLEAQPAESDRTVQKKEKSNLS